MMTLMALRDCVEVSGLDFFPGMSKSVAHQMEEWFNAPACDDFVLAATQRPGAHESVVRPLVSEPQRRRPFQPHCRGSTLRANLGPPIPPAADRRADRRAAQ